MHNTNNIVALLIPADLAVPMKPVEITTDLASMYPIIGTTIVQPVALRHFPDCLLWMDEDIMCHPNNCVPNLRATILAGIGLYGTAILVSEKNQKFRSWNENNTLPFALCVLQSYSEEVANSNVGRMMVLNMTKEIA